MNLNQVTVPSLDVERAVEFYNILGLRLIVDALPRYVRFECVDGDSTLSIHEVDQLPKGEGIVLYFEEPDLDTVVDNLKTKGLTFTLSPTDQPWLCLPAGFPQSAPGG